MAGIQGPGALQLQGERTSGQDVRTANVMAVAAVANIVKSSLGPVGLDKVRMASEIYTHTEVLCPSMRVRLH